MENETVVLLIWASAYEVVRNKTESYAKIKEGAG
jgi:hypothetical protein